jgi:hypothetical protein
MPEPLKLESVVLSADPAESLSSPPIDEELALSVRGLLSAGHGRIHIAAVVKNVHGTRRVDRPVFKELLGKMETFVQAGLLVYAPPNQYRASGLWADETPTANDYVSGIAPLTQRRQRPRKREVEALDEMIHNSGISSQKPSSNHRRNRPSVRRNQRRH